MRDLKTARSAYPVVSEASRQAVPAQPRNHTSVRKELGPVNLIKQCLQLQATRSRLEVRPQTATCKLSRNRINEHLSLFRAQVVHLCPVKQRCKLRSLPLDHFSKENSLLGIERLSGPRCLHCPPRTPEKLVR